MSKKRTSLLMWAIIELDVSRCLHDVIAAVAAAAGCYCPSRCPFLSRPRRLTRLAVRDPRLQGILESVWTPALGPYLPARHWPSGPPRLAFPDQIAGGVKEALDGGLMWGGRRK
ncbi:hypothetical protein BDY21DRAFT_356675 [Lineolata rhizophorae]|uniref:Uncharacterized protein n=1 Tax=Lineolata rhizophorae TaxID=578093 RepID=A0A6A6NN22_9PEZI|nr:hypothetical protein BDY21DRAFT_356675 [Lineolata rhizophorae]